MAKGFRQNKKPTNKDVSAQQDRMSQLIQFLSQQCMNAQQEVQKLKQEHKMVVEVMRSRTVDKAEKDDFVMIDYLGRFLEEDGSLGDTFEGGVGDSYVIQLGSGQLVGNFEDNLLGSAPGDEKTIEVTFPEDYPEALKEKKASFQVKVINVWRPVDPDKTIGTEYQRIEDEKRKEIEAKAAEAKKAEEESDAKDQ